VPVLSSDVKNYIAESVFFLKLPHESQLLASVSKIITYHAVKYHLCPLALHLYIETTTVQMQTQ
jgi:hypothetical protein